MLEEAKYEQWLHAFEASHGRRLRVLHIGNIANNAYLVAKFLRRSGVEADVLSYDYYHAMATPEWEELSINHDYGDDYRPRFAREDIGSYERPGWFVSGPFSLCVKYLLAMRSEDRKKRDHLWALLRQTQLGNGPRAIDIEISGSGFIDSLQKFITWFPRKAAISATMIPYRVLRLVGRIIHRSLRAMAFHGHLRSFRSLG